MLRFTGCLLALVCGSVMAGPPAGSLDPSFGSAGGVVSTTFKGSGGGDAFFTSMAEDTYGRIVVAGVVWRDSSQCIGLARYSRDGEYDPLFHTGLNNNEGTVCLADLEGLLNPETDFLGEFSSLAISKDGDFYVTGLAIIVAENLSKRAATFVCRFSPSGKKEQCALLDMAGPLVGGSNFRPLIFFRNDQLLVITRTESHPALLRISTENMSVQSQSPMLPANSGTADANVFDAILTKAGNVAAVGKAVFGTGIEPFVVLVDPDTNLPVPQFHGNGFRRLSFDLNDNPSDWAVGVAEAKNGDLLISAQIGLSEAKSAIGLARLNSAGGNAPEFNGGQLLTLFENFDADVVPFAVAQSRGGKIIVSGAINFPGNNRGSFALRLNGNGTYDTSFAGGYAFFDLSPKLDASFSMVLQGEQPMLAGIAQLPDRLDFTLFRISDGRLFKDEFEAAD